MIKRRLSLFENFRKEERGKLTMTGNSFPVAEENWTRERPTIVCLCGSTRFSEAFQKAQLEETLAGKIVLTIGCNMKTDDEIFGHFSVGELKRIKAGLDRLHMRKIDLADEVLILNVDNYIGESTQRELNYAKHEGKKIRFLEGEN